MDLPIGMSFCHVASGGGGEDEAATGGGVGGGRALFHGYVVCTRAE
eukprot:COSAG03_NODE_18149_length_361_cov_0.545802_1_plen_45_part_10